MISNTTNNSGESATWVKDIGTADFAKEVLEASLHAIILVDFWADWCGPCKTLTPVLEQVVQAYDGKVRLVKIDVDAHQMLAQQMQIRSLPSVYMFFGGDVVDGFVGVIPKQEIEQKIDTVLQQANLAAPQETDTEKLWQQVDALLEKREFASAESVLSHILNIHEGDKKAYSTWLHLGLLQADSEREQKARDFLADQEQARDDDIASIKASLESLLHLDEETRVMVSPSNESDVEMEQSQQQALHHIAERNFDSAIETLLEMVKKNPAWQEGRARDTLLRLFIAMGSFDSRVPLARSRLSNILFS